MFWRWWTAGTTSSVGSAVGAVALPLTALTVLDASAFEMGLVAAASCVAWLVIGLPAGVIVQRLPLRGAQVGADLARAAAVASWRRPGDPRGAQSGRTAAATRRARAGRVSTSTLSRYWSTAPTGGRARSAGSAMAARSAAVNRSACRTRNGRS